MTLQKSTSVVSLYGPCTPHSEQDSLYMVFPQEGGEAGKQYYNIHAKHMYYYSCVLEMVTYKMESQLNMLHSKWWYLELVLFDAFKVGTDPVSLWYTEFHKEIKIYIYIYIYIEISIYSVTHAWQRMTRNILKMSLSICCKYKMGKQELEKETDISDE